MAHAKTQPANRGGQIVLGIYAFIVNGAYVALVYCLGRTWSMVDVKFTTWFLIVLSFIVVIADILFVNAFTSMSEHVTLMQLPDPMPRYAPSLTNECTSPVTVQAPPAPSRKSKGLIIGVASVLVGIGIGAVVGYMMRSQKKS
jgi:hypothetical protein